MRSFITVRLLINQYDRVMGSRTQGCFKQLDPIVTSSMRFNDRKVLGYPQLIQGIEKAKAREQAAGYAISKAKFGYRQTGEVVDLMRARKHCFGGIGTMLTVSLSERTDLHLYRRDQKEYNMRKMV